MIRWVWLFFLAVPCLAEQCVTLAWDANTESDLGGYIVYWGSVSRNYTNAENVGNITTNTVCGLLDGVTYYFAVKAYNTNGLVSDFSDEVSYSSNGAPSVIRGLRIRLGRTYGLIDVIKPEMEFVSEPRGQCHVCSKL